MKLKVENLVSNLKIWEAVAQFGNPIDVTTKHYLQEDGFGGGRTRSVACMAWVWGQWLLNGAKPAIRAHVDPFVERGLEMEELSSLFYMRPIHELYLLHCAIFASDDAQLKKLATKVIDAAGFKTYKPQNDGELYASAWCGMLKYWILGDWQKAAEQFEIIWGANREISFRAAGKPLVTAWLKRDWKAFVKLQRKDFEKLWTRARKDGTVISENGRETIVNMEPVRHIQHSWCWAHCGMALLANRQGIEVATDPFWFPPHALTCASS
jgi:hypothetical protein